MNTETLYAAIGEIREDYIVDAETAFGRAHRPVWKMLAAAGLAVVLLALPVRAEMANGYVSNLLAPLYGSAQTELVDKIGVPVDASVTVGGYTLTADAIIGDRYNIAIVYTLSREDGSPVGDGLHFAEHAGFVGSGGGGGWYGYEPSADGTTLQIIEVWTSSGGLFLNRNATFRFRDLMRFDEELQEDVPVQEGEWQLQFAVRYEDTSVRIPLGDGKVTDAEGTEYEIRKVLLSPVGIHIDFTAPNPHTDDTFIESLGRAFSVSLRLSDGTILAIEDRNLGTRGSEKSAVYTVDFGALFDEPVRLETVKAVIICGMELPVSISG